MSYFKSGYFTPQYYNKYWQAEGAGDTARLDVNAVAAVSWSGEAIQAPIPEDRPPQVIGGGAA